MEMERHDITIDQVHFDRYRIDVFKGAAQRQGFAQSAEFKECGQGFVSMGVRIDSLETALLEKRVRHAMHPVLTLGASHCIVELDNAGNKRYTKKKSAQKIDGMIALVMSIYPLVAPEELEKAVDVAALCG
jgi:phage terminase large subunit-like protein